MKRWIPVALLTAVILAIGVAIGSPPAPYPSARSAGPSGLRVAARYLEETGRRVELLDAPAADDGVVVVALPSLRPWMSDEADALATWVARGGEIVLLTSTGATLPSALESAFHLSSTQVPAVRARSLDAWRQQVTEGRRADGRAGTLQGGLGRWRVDCPAAAEVTWRGADDVPRVCVGRHGKGWITVVNDVSVLSNARLAVADHLAFLEEIFPEGATVRFEELHQGPPPATEAEHAGRLDAVLAQAALVYLLVAWQRARPLGPSRPVLRDREPGLVAELRTLGRLHAAGNHGLDAAHRLTVMARTRFAGDDRLATLPKELDTLPRALALGRRLAEMERRTG